MPTRPARRPVGAITRGTTNPNRLRRVDRWIGHALGGVLRAAPPGRPPVVVDLGYGAAPVTVLELAERLRRVRQDVRVVGVEIDPERVERGRAVADPPRVDFVLGGFEVPLPAEVGASAPTVVRAFNVLRQYDESEVAPAWEQVVGRLAPGGALVEGTCDELGRLAAWVDVRRGDGRGRSVQWSRRQPSVQGRRTPPGMPQPPFARASIRRRATTGQCDGPAPHHLSHAARAWGRDDARCIR